MTHSTDTEKAVLGGTLLTGTIPMLERDDFHHVRHQRIWDALIALDKRQAPIDIISLTTELGAKGDEMMYVTTLADQVPGIDHLTHHAETLRELARKRRVLEASENNIRAIKSGEDADVVLAGFDKFVGVTHGDMKPLAAREIFADRCDYYEKLYKGEIEPGIITGYHDCDRLAPIHKQNLVVVGGRPGMGKTGYAVGVAAGASRQGIPTLFFSLEMPKEEIIDRYASRVGGIDGRKMTNGQFVDSDFGRLQTVTGRVDSASLHIIDTPALSSAKIKSITAAFQREHGLGLVIIDHLHKMKEYNNPSSYHVMYGDSVSGVKDMAKSLDVPVMLLVQLNRGVEQRDPPIPVMSDIRETGKVEEEADKIWFLYRQDYYEDLNKLKKPNPELKGIGCAYLAKNRQGPTGEVRMQWNAATASYRNLSRE